MKVSYQWLQEHFTNTLPSPEVLSEMLTLKAYEVEDIESIGSDYVLDIDVLPNRASDSLSHMGIAREISTLSGIPLKEEEITARALAESKISDLVELSLESNLVRRALKRVALDVKIGESPVWLKERLKTLGQRSINNIVDITNYVMLETGQPVHAFDLDKIHGESDSVHVMIREAQDGEKITILDGTEYELTSGMLVISDDKQTLDIAGIKGGKVSGVGQETTRVLLSVCNFDPVSIRTTSQALSLRTDASKRFENGVSSEVARSAMELLSSLLEEHAGAQITPDLIDEHPFPQEQKKVVISLEKINRVLGTSLKNEEVRDIFDRLFFEYIEDVDAFTVSVPFYRLDITESIDLVEEVGRVYDYKNIPTQEVARVDQEGRDAREFMITNIIRDIAVREGYSELYTYSLQEKGDIELENKLASDKGFLRKDLSSGVRKALAENMKRKDLFGEDDLKVFEIGHIFNMKGEETHIAIGIKSITGSTTGEPEILALKEVIEGELGYSLKGDIQDGILEIDLTDIINSESKLSNVELATISCDVTFKEPSPYPYILRDIAVWIPNEIEKPVSLMEEILLEEAGGYLVKYWIFDTFEKEDRTSYAFRLVFQSDKKTLTDEEINKIMDNITQLLNSKKDFEVR